MTAALRLYCTRCLHTGALHSGASCGGDWGALELDQEPPHARGVPALIRGARAGVDEVHDALPRIGARLQSVGARLLRGCLVRTVRRLALLEVCGLLLVELLQFILRLLALLFLLALLLAEAFLQLPLVLVLPLTQSV